MLGAIIPSIIGIIDKIIPDPKAASDAKLKLLELEQNGEFHQLDQEVADRASARKREEDMSSSGHQDFITPILAVCITVGFFTLLFSVFFFPIQQNMMNVANLLIGTLGTAWVAVVTYYFGSSSGSRGKDAVIASLGAQTHAAQNNVRK